MGKGIFTIFWTEEELKLHASNYGAELKRNIQEVPEFRTEKWVVWYCPVIRKGKMLDKWGIADLVDGKGINKRWVEGLEEALNNAQKNSKQ